jgi:hypothetical protein
MRMSGETYEALREAIGGIDSEYWRDRYRSGDFPRADSVKDLNLRYRWDLFYAVKGQEIVGDGDLSSDHINTALRRIVAAL